MSNIWISSDFHYHHKNIVAGESSWGSADGGIHGKQKCRKFDTLKEHDDTLVENINKHVKFNDTLYFLGDWSFGGFDYVEEFARRLDSQNIHFFYGNHDHHIEKNKENCRRRFKSAQHYGKMTVAGQSVVMSHYAQRTWDKGHHGTWMLYGHSHGTLPDYEGIQMAMVSVNKASAFDVEDKWVDEWQPIKVKYKTMDVGIDTHPEFRPYHFDEIKEIMDKRVNLLVDHHNEGTS